MSKDMKSVDEMVDFARQLRLHAEGRLAIHVRVSLLERYFRDEHYRRFIAMTLRPLLTKYDAAMFALPTNDVVLITKDAKIDHIDPLLHHIRRKFRDSALIKSLDPVQGISDAFVEWFDIGEDYQGFRKYIEELADEIAVDVAKPAPEQEADPINPWPGKLKAQSPSAIEDKPSTKRKMKMVPIKPPSKEIRDPRELDPVLMVALHKALSTADVTNMLRRQRVMAVVGKEPSEAVIEHLFVPVSVVFGKLLMAKVYSHDRWLEGYLAELLARRLLLSLPNMENRESVASSLRISCAAIGDAGFDRFDQSLGGLSRSAIILELSVADVVTNFGDYLYALAKISSMGYRVMIGDIDLRALRWLDYHSFDADFVKLRLPAGETEDWRTPELEAALRDQIIRIGIGRVVLEGCDNEEQIEIGQRLGITLFQGEAVSPMTG